MNASGESSQLRNPETAAVRLEKYLRSNACIVYHENLPDREYSEVKCPIYGVPKTIELFVRLSGGKATFVGVVLSTVEFPSMADRVFGLDVDDHATAFGLADQLWDRHQAQLLEK